jgi:hypothetical protein
MCVATVLRKLLKDYMLKFIKKEDKKIFINYTIKVGELTHPLKNKTE